MEKADIIYPCEWPYQIIGTDEALIKEAVANILKDKKFTLVYSKKSGKGNYVSLKLKTEVSSEAHRVTIFEAIRTLDFVKMVL